MNLGAVGQYSERTSKGWYLAKNHDASFDGEVTSIVSDNNKITTTFNNGGNLQAGKIPTLETQHNDEITDLQEAKLTIETDDWLNSNNNFYNVSFKNQSTLSGTGNTGHLLGVNNNVDKNGKMSW